MSLSLKRLRWHESKSYQPEVADLYVDRVIDARMGPNTCSTLTSLMWSQPPGQIRTQLHKVLASAAFANAERMRRFLEFVVEHTLSSPDEHLKEMMIGIELYAGHGEFDPRITAVVRVDASRLRTKLREYYFSEGAADPLVFDLPKGSYTPVFRKASIQVDSAPPYHHHFH